MSTLPPPGFTAVTIAGSVFFIPDPGRESPWGEELQEALLALIEQVNGLGGAFDINNRLSILTSAPTSFTSLSTITIDPSVLNGAILSYSAKYTTSSVTSSEIGQAYCVYDPNQAASSKFIVAKQNAGTANIGFYVTDVGQVQISVPEGIAGTGFSLRIRTSIRAMEL